MDINEVNKKLIEIVKTFNNEDIGIKVLYFSPHKYEFGSNITEYYIRINIPSNQSSDYLTVFRHSRIDNTYVQAYTVNINNLEQLLIKKLVLE